MTPCPLISEVPAQGGGNALAQRRLHPVTTVSVVYIAVQHDPAFVHYANRFVQTYKQFEGGFNHRLIVVCNGGKLAPKMKSIFEGLSCEFVERPNDGGWDVSAYQAVANRRPCDLLVCLGESVRFHRADWLTRLVDSANQYGEGMYGCLSSHAIRAHLNTTAFAVSPRFLCQYPPVKNKAERYEFEHGENAMWRMIRAKGGATRLVTWDGCWDAGDWRKPENILWRGDQSNCLVLCNHTDKFFGATGLTRAAWAARADGAFKKNNE